MTTRFLEAVENFKIPREIKNDIIYCQRTLQSYLNVHQMIVRTAVDEDKDARQGKLDVIEHEIYEINCEQQYLLLRLRRAIDEFYKSLQKDIPVDHRLMNEHVSRQLVPMIQNKDYICTPFIVQGRSTENQLKEAYLPKSKFKDVRKSPTSLSASTSNSSPESGQSSNGGLQAPSFALTSKRVSLLKPISERVLETPPIAPAYSSEVIIPDDEKLVKIEEPVLPVSSKVKLSRLNLRQALSKAAAAINVTPTPQQSSSSVGVSNNPPVKATRTVVEHVKKSQTKPTKTDSSSSEESVDPRIRCLPQVHLKNRPEEYTKEEFFRVLQVYTPEDIQLMQQRRSKRKRKNIYNNERADFHYGHIDYVTSPNVVPPKKRKKEFLLSPRARGVQKKKRVVEPDRSASSSPETKAFCNECSLNTGALNQCKECNGHYHEKCHGEVPTRKSDVLCPACERSKLMEREAQRREEAQSLCGQYRELEAKLVVERSRRQELQQKSKVFKTDMKNLFNIVETIKSDELHS